MHRANRTAQFPITRDRACILNFGYHEERSAEQSSTKITVSVEDSCSWNFAPEIVWLEIPGVPRVMGTCEQDASRKSHGVLLLLAPASPRRSQ